MDFNLSHLKSQELLVEESWIEKKSENDLPSVDCWVECKIEADSKRIYELFFDVNGCYTYNFLMDHCKYYRIIKL